MEINGRSGIWRHRLAAGAAILALGGAGALASGCGEDEGTLDDAAEGIEEGANDAKQGAEEAAEDAGLGEDEGGDKGGGEK